MALSGYGPLMGQFATVAKSKVRAYGYLGQNGSKVGCDPRGRKSLTIMGATEEMFACFERDGEDAVRKALAIGKYLPNDDAVAKEWLRRKDHARAEAFQAEQVATAKRAADAAESSASAAEKAAAAAREQAEAALTHAGLIEGANRRATIALVIAAISLISSIMIAFLKH